MKGRKDDPQSLEGRIHRSQTNPVVILWAHTGRIHKSVTVLWMCMGGILTSNHFQEITCKQQQSPHQKFPFLFLAQKD